MGTLHPCLHQGITLDPLGPLRPPAAIVMALSKINAPIFFLYYPLIIHKLKRRSWLLFLVLKNSISMYMDVHSRLLLITSLFYTYFKSIKVSLLWQHLEYQDGPLYYQLKIMNLFLNLVVSTEMLIQ